MNFCTAFWLLLLRNVAEAEVKYQIRDEWAQFITEKLKDGLVDEIVSCLEPSTHSIKNPALAIAGLRDVFIEMGLTTTAGVAGDKALELGQQTSIEITKCVHIINQIMKVFQSELATKPLFIMKSDRGSYYETKDTILGRAVIKKYSSILVDAEEAGNCFALARYTACVFHLMRILELILRKFEVYPSVKTKNGLF